MVPVAYDVDFWRREGDSGDVTRGNLDLRQRNLTAGHRSRQPDPQALQPCLMPRSHPVESRDTLLGRGASDLRGGRRLESASCDSEQMASWLHLLYVDPDLGTARHGNQRKISRVAEVELEALTVVRQPRLAVVIPADHFLLRCKIEVAGENLP